MTNLREARDTGKLDQFIAEREAEAARDGYPKAFNCTLKAVAKTSSASLKASSLKASKRVCSAD